MTNTETPALSNFDKVRALVDVEFEGFYTGPITPAVQAGLDEGFLTVWPVTSGGESTSVRLTPEGRTRLAGFRALFAPLA